MKGRIVAVLALVLVTLSASEAGARKDEDRREVEGRALFAKGDYPAALDIFATLFAEKNDPIYLRNIGRCYQKLEQPGKAIDAFREYLRRAKVKPAERTEIEGFISNMEEMQKRQAATTPPPATESRPTPPHESATPAPVAAAPAPEPSGASAPGAVLVQPATPDEEPKADKGSIARRWWFWTGLAVLVAGGTATAFVLARPTIPTCPSNTPCPR